VVVVVEAVEAVEAVEVVVLQEVANTMKRGHMEVGKGSFELEETLLQESRTIATLSVCVQIQVT
jgi:hypothetical protein